MASCGPAGATGTKIASAMWDGFSGLSHRPSISAAFRGEFDRGITLHSHADLEILLEGFNRAYALGPAACAKFKNFAQVTGASNLKRLRCAEVTCGMRALG